MEKVAFSPIYFIQKMLYGTHIKRSPPFHYNHGEVWFFHINILGMPRILITYAKIKQKFTEPIFLTATSSGLLKENLRLWTCVVGYITTDFSSFSYGLVNIKYICSVCLFNLCQRYNVYVERLWILKNVFIYLFSQKRNISYLMIQGEKRCREIQIKCRFFLS